MPGAPWRGGLAVYSPRKSHKIGKLLKMAVCWPEGQKSIVWRVMSLSRVRLVSSPIDQLLRVLLHRVVSSRQQPPRLTGIRGLRQPLAGDSSSSRSHMPLRGRGAVGRTHRVLFDLRGYKRWPHAIWQLGLSAFHHGSCGTSSSFAGHTCASRPTVSRPRMSRRIVCWCWFARRRPGRKVITVAPNLLH